VFDYGPAQIECRNVRFVLTKPSTLCGGYGKALLFLARKGKDITLSPGFLEEPLFLDPLSKAGLRTDPEYSPCRTIEPLKD
jgi:hypothetical protein